MSRVSNEIANNIIASNDIVDVLRDFIELRKKGQSYVALCPFHNDTNPSMSIDTRRQIFKCFVCNTGGNALTFLKLFKKWSYIESIKYLANKAGIDFDYSENTYESDNQNKLSQTDIKVYEVLDKANSFYKSELIKSNNPVIQAFLKKRNLSYNDCNKYDIGYVPVMRFKEVFASEIENELSILTNASLISPNNKEEFFKNRITFGIRNEQNQIVGFSARTLDDSKPKYINSSDNNYFKKSSILYNLNNVYQESNFNQIIITEGFFDVIALNKCNINEAVCLMGTALTKEHVYKLQKFKKIILFLDGDNAGQESTFKTIKTLLQNNYTNIYVVKSNNKLDPDELLNTYGADAVKNLINDASLYIYFVYDYLRLKFGLYDGFNIINVNEMQFQKFGTEFYPFWAYLSQNAASVFNEKLKKEYNRDINFIIDKGKNFNNDFSTFNNVNLNNYDKPYDYNDSFYYDGIVDSQSFNEQPSINSPKLYKPIKQEYKQNWIEKMLLILLHYPNLQEFFYKNYSKEPFESIELNSSALEFNKDLKVIYKKLINHIKIDEGESKSIIKKFTEEGKDLFISKLNFDNKDIVQLENDFAEIYKRARDDDLKRYNYYIVNDLGANGSGIFTNDKIVKEILEKQRQNKLKMDDEEQNE
ncbi:DNA primase [Mycoplasmopsis agalactiae]|uniref:DNA primase n=1 Tax=Mycoplasmopsis agalactiae TaxID=2110 RepID=UPI002F3EFE13